MGEQDAKGMWDDLIRLLRNFVERLSQPIRRMIGRGGHFLAGKGTEKAKEFVDARKGSAAMDAVLDDGNYKQYTMSSYFDFNNINKVIEAAKQQNVKICIEKLDQQDGKKVLSKKDMEHLTDLHNEKKRLSVEQSRLANRYAGKPDGKFHKKMKEISDKLDQVEKDIQSINAKNCLYTVYANIRHAQFIDAMDQYKLDPLQADIQKKEGLIANRTKMAFKDRGFAEIIAPYKELPVKFGTIEVALEEAQAGSFPGKEGVILNYGTIDCDTQLQGKTILEVSVSKDTYSKLRKDPDFKIPHEAKVFPVGDRVLLACESSYATGILPKLDAVREIGEDSFQVQFRTPDMLDDEKSFTDQQSGMTTFAMNMESQILGRLEEFYNKVRTEWQSTYIATRVLYKDNDPTPQIVVKTNLSEDAVRDYLEVSKKNEITQVHELDLQTDYAKTIQEFKMNDIDLDAYQYEYDKQQNDEKKKPEEELETPINNEEIPEKAEKNNPPKDKGER